MSKNPNPEIRIPNVNPSLKRDLENIAANIGIGVTALLKSDLRKIVDSYPPEMKKPNKD